MSRRPDPYRCHRCRYAFVTMASFDAHQTPGGCVKPWEAGMAPDRRRWPNTAWGLTHPTPAQLRHPEDMAAMRAAMRDFAQAMRETLFAPMMSELQ